MQKAYKNLDIQFLPDSVVEKINQTQLKEGLTQLSDQTIIQNQNNDHISTYILANNTLDQIGEFSNYLMYLNEGMYDSLINYWS
jgi:hypothetical protein